MGNAQKSRITFYTGLALALCVSVATHFYRLTHTFTFLGDEARDVLIVRKMFDTGPVLLGPQTSVGNMYLGPAYYYLIAPALFLSNMDPVGPAAFVALLAVATTGLIFHYAYKKWGIKAAIGGSLFYALSPVMLHYSRSSWNPNVVPFFTMFLLYIYEWKGWKAWLALGLIAGMIFQLHYVALVGVALIGLLMAWRDRHMLATHVFWAAAGFIIVSAPFWLFEVRHDFVNSRAFITFITQGSDNDIGKSYGERIVAAGLVIIKGIVGSGSLMLTQLPTLLLIVSALLIFVVLPYIGGGFLWYLLVGSILLTALLRSTVYTHYVSHVFPIVVLAWASLIGSSKKIISLAAMAIFVYMVIHSVPTLKYNFHDIDSSEVRKAQDAVAYIQKEASGKPFNVTAWGTFATPVEYYLSLTSNKPQNTETELIFVLCEGGPCSLDLETTPLLFAGGPAHPATVAYLGHPAMLEYTKKRRIVKNEMIGYNLWVATIVPEKYN